MRTRQSDGSEIFDVKDERHLDYWISQPVDVYLVIRQQDETRGEAVIRWMNVTRHLSQRKNKGSRQIVFAGEKLDAAAVWRARDGFFPPGRAKKQCVPLGPVGGQAFPVYPENWSAISHQRPSSFLRTNMSRPVRFRRLAPIVTSIT